MEKLRSGRSAPSSPCPRPPSPARGFTLLEVLVAMGIALIVLSAATAVLTSAQAQRSTSERTLAVSTAAASAFLIMQRDIQNAGFKAPSSLLSVRVLDAPVTLSNGLDPATTTSANCPGASDGLMAGADVLELAFGDVNRTSGMVSSVGAPIDAATWSLTYQTMLPFGPGDPVAPASRMVLFVATDPTLLGRSCLGLSETPGAGVANSKVKMLTRDSAPVAAATTTYPNCPQATMAAWIVTQRVRYMVCQPSAANAHSGLYRQITNATDGSFTGNPPQLVQEDIEDLQISPRLRNDTGTFTAKTDCECHGPPEVPVAAGGYCYCNRVVGAPNTYAETVAVDETAASSRTVGLDIALQAMQHTTLAQGKSRRPALYNHAGAGADDAILSVRRVQRGTVGTPNLTIVSP